MTEKLTLKKLSGELETLRMRVLELEQQLEQKLELKLEATLEKAVTRLGSRIESSNLPGHGAGIDTGYRQGLIAKEAYLIAERRGFQDGDPEQDWARAEKQVNHRLMQEGIPGKPATHSKRAATKKARTIPARPAK